MSAVRAPRLAGVAGGVGTTTLAASVRGYDRGTAVDQGVEVLVCRSTGVSLHAAAATLSWLASLGVPRPVLAVVGDQPVSPRGPVRARLRMIEPQAAGLVRVPYVPHWRDLTDPLAEAARLGECPTDQLPRSLRGYGEALAELAEALLCSGLLAGASSATSHPLPRTHATPRPPASAPPPGVTSTGPRRAVTSTGPRPPVTGTGPFPAVTSTRPRRAVTSTGPRPPVTSTGPYPAVTNTGPYPAVTTTGPRPAVTATGPQRVGTGSGPRPAMAGAQTTTGPPHGASGTGSHTALAARRRAEHLSVPVPPGGAR